MWLRSGSDFLFVPAGERPYQCQTCERTFTLKHSLVRHQRIHLKPRGADGADAASEDGDSRASTCPPSENESESGAAGAKELEEEPAEDSDPAAVDAGEEEDERSADAATETISGRESSSTSGAASADGFIQGMLEIHAKPSLERILPGGEPPLVGVD